MTDRPLTTGEAADALARDVLELLSECGRLREQLDAARAELRRYDTALAVLEASTEKIGDGSDADWIVEYRWKTGAYHKILGFRPKVLALAAEFTRAREQLDALLTACTFVSSLPGDTGSPKPPSVEAWQAARAALGVEGPSAVREQEA